MSPIPIPPAPSGEHFRQSARSLSSTFSSIPSTVRQTDLADTSNIHISIHKNIPFIPRLVQHMSTVISRASGSTSPSSSLSLSKRQARILAIPTTYAGLQDGPAPGSVVGIVLGAVAGFLLVLWLLYTCFTMNGYDLGGRGEIVEEEVVRRRSRSPRRSMSRSETIEITKSRSTAPRERIVEEIRRVSRPAPERDPIDLVDDIVEVIEDHSPSPPPPSRRPSKRTSGYRTVDPAEYGGGGRPIREVR